ncbi:MAG TPA: LUD domain-containing protein [Edaphocola sp.]|nr:LUD domain-containing protein [Edaphocola sp.]
MVGSKNSRARENILKRIEAALFEEQVEKPFPEIESEKAINPFAPLSKKTLEETFAFEFSKSGGYFIFCNDKNDFAFQLRNLVEAKNWKEIMCAPTEIFTFLLNQGLDFIRNINFRSETVDGCITECEAAVARTGSLLFSSRQPFGRTAPIFFPVHIIILKGNQIVEDIDIALEKMQNKYGVNNMPSMINLNTGPSRTADIEKTLVTGVHGPKEVYCFFIND